MEVDSSSASESSPARAPPPSSARRKRRGVKLTKAEREARQQQRRAAAEGLIGVATEDESGADFEMRRTRLLAHVHQAEWDAAAALGGESIQLAEVLLRALLPLGRHKLVSHLAACPLPCLLQR